MVVITKY